jgi:uncharacterized CHY-type Zn-finger protein
MCKHVLNSQVYFQAKCCKKWFECTECHDENSDHKYQFSSQLRFTCKSCRACFDRNFKHFSDRDKCCSVCAMPWVIPGITPESKLFEASNHIIGSCINEITDIHHPYFASFE